jgi:Na+/proline symporter
LNYTILGIGAYIAAQIGIGVYVSRLIKTESDYLLAGRKLGPSLGAFTIFATWFGAETCIGSAGAIYDRGLSGGHADPFGFGLCILLMALVYARPLWRRGLTTLADLYRDRYGVMAERVAVFVMLPSSVLWAGAQIRAFGQIISQASGIDVTLTITIAAVIVVVYTVFGGLLATAYTDLLQGAVLIGGLFLLLGFLLHAEGVQVLGTIPAERLNLFPASAGGWMDQIEAWAIPVCGSVVAAELVGRVLSTRSEHVAQRAAFSASGLYLVVGLVPVVIGLTGAQLLPNLTDSEQILPMMAQTYLPAALYIVFTGALVSAILSTVDTSLLVAGSLLSHNVVVPIARVTSEKAKIAFARGGVVLFGGIAYVLALSSEGVYDLVLEASAFGSAGLFVCATCALFTKLGGSRTAVLTLLMGIVSWVLFAYVLVLPYPYLGSLLITGLTFALSGIQESRRG